MLWRWGIKSVVMEIPSILFSCGWVYEALPPDFSWPVIVMVARHCHGGMRWFRGGFHLPSLSSWLRVSQAQAFYLPLTLTHCHSLTLTQSHSLSLTLTHSHSLSLTLTHSQKLGYSSRARRGEVTSTPILWSSVINILKAKCNTQNCTDTYY